MTATQLTELAIFYGGLSIVLVAAVLYALHVSRKKRFRSIASESCDALILELTDRAHVASTYVQMALGGHPALARDPELMALYQGAVDKLEDLYQAAGCRSGTLSREESERLARVASRATVFFGDIEASLTWLQKPHPMLRGSSPLELARTEPGAREVLRILASAEHGIPV